MSVGSGSAVLQPRIEAAEAATAGFRLMRAEPRTWLAWAGVSLVFYAIIGVATFGAVGPQMAALTAAPGVTPDPATVFAALGHAAPVYLLIAVLSLGFYAVFYAAVNRALLRPQEGGWRHLRLGADELRQLAVLILQTLVFFGAYLGLTIVLVVFISLGAVLAGLAGGGAAKAGLAILVGLLTFVGILAEFAALAWVAVRLSLASALTFDTGRVRVFGSWRLTRGVFWPLLGAYLLTLVFLALVTLGPLFVSAVIAALTGAAGGVGSFLLRPDMSSPAAYFGPARIVSFVLGAAVLPVYMSLLVGVAASAYAQILRTGGYAAGSRVTAGSAEVFGPAA